MTIQHADIPDAQLHEPKGAAGASANTVYVADGAGSGTWQKVDENSLDYTAAIVPLIQADLDDGDIDVTGRFWVQVEIPDVSTLNSSVLVPIPEAATLIKAELVLGGAITIADAIVSFTTAAAASMGTGVTILFTGSAAGNQYTFTPNANETFAAGTYMKINSDGGSTDAQKVYVACLFEKILNVP
jgi:hypothetical protein